MTAHPFDIKASASAAHPDELMITWGNLPKGSIASIYLPAVASADIIALANSMYGNHRLSVTDEHTIQCPCGDVTLVPVPPGQGPYAGLLSIDLPSAGGRGRSYTIAVRQLTQVSASFRPPPPPNQIAERRTPEIIVPPEPFSWRQAQGGFQYTITVKPTGELLYPQERLLAWLKWRIGVTPPAGRWRPVLGRYLSLTEGLVITLGGDPSKIPPSQTGAVPGKGPSHGEHELTGKVVAIDYDRFGDFCGFTVLSEPGRERHFDAREPKIEDVVYRAWVERSVISVFAEEDGRHRPARLILRRPH
ncbi:MAG: hypothetical protein WAL85_07175 [Candidatus Korobacteraceae bacterium]